MLLRVRVIHDYNEVMRRVIRSAASIHWHLSGLSSDEDEGWSNFSRCAGLNKIKRRAAAVAVSWIHMIHRHR